MAYNLKYRVTSATQSNTISVVEMYIDEAVASVIDYNGVSVQLQYIPRSDDIYEPIYASQLSVVIDVTDNPNNLPNFVSLNDRKYLVKLKIDGVYKWTGWALSDNVQYSFTTGRKQLSFDAIDGLGLLDYFPYPFVDTATVTSISPVKILNFIVNCLSQIGFDSGLNIYTVCSYYSQYMSNRNSGIANEPFNQGFLRPNYFLNNDGTYQTSLEVLTKIAKSFGCRIYQANNKWNIVAINEMASNSYFYTEYLANGTYSTAGVASIVSTVQAFTGNTSGLYFVDNSQIKIFKKGYNNFVQNYQLQYSPNYVVNGNLKTLFAGFPLQWDSFTNGTGGSITLITKTNESSNQFQLITGSSGGGVSGFTYVSAASMAGIKNDTVDISITYFNQELGKKRGRLKLQITASGVGAPSYYYNKDKVWQDATVAPFGNYYLVDEAAENNINNFTLTTNALPISGTLTYALELFDAPNCCTTVTVADFNLTFNSPISDIRTTSILTADNQYTLELDLPFGYPVYTGDGVDRYPFNLALGNILVLYNTMYVASSGWYKFNRVGIFQGLSQLIMKEYINAYRRNLVNIDSNMFGVENEEGTFSGGSIIKFDDTDPAQINVSEKFYMTGNMTIDIVKGEIQSTVLDISNVAIESTITTIYTVNGINYN
jgi:hypothetical protein